MPKLSLFFDNKQPNTCLWALHSELKSKKTCILLTRVQDKTLTQKNQVGFDFGFLPKLFSMYETGKDQFFKAFIVDSINSIFYPLVLIDFKECKPF